MDLSGHRAADGDVQVEVGLSLLAGHVPHQGGDLILPLIALGKAPQFSFCAAFSNPSKNWQAFFRSVSSGWPLAIPPTSLKGPKVS